MKNVTIYTTQYCPHCSRAKNILKMKNVFFQEVDLTNDDKRREELQDETGWMTVPMIFIGEKFIGGADDLVELDSQGKLDGLLNRE